MKCRVAHSLVHCHALLVLNGALCVMPAQQRELAAGAMLTARIPGGETQTYRIEATSGQFLRVLLEQKGSDLELQLNAPGGVLAALSNLPNGAWGPESVAVITEPGAYSILVKAPAGAEAEYDLTVVQRPPSSQDHQRVAGEKAMATVRKLRAARTAESQRAAVEEYGRALRHFEAVGEPYWQYLVLNGIATLHAQSGDFRRGLELFERALEFARQAGDRAVLSVLLNCGGMHDVLGDLTRARQLYEEVLNIARKLGDSLNTAIALNNIGKLYLDMSDWRRAMAAYRDALPLFQSAKDSVRESLALMNLGVVYNAVGEPETARDYLRQALAIRRAAGDNARQPPILNNLGLSYLQLGRPKEAISYFEQSLVIGQAIGDRMAQSHALNFLAGAHADLREPEKAIVLLERALDLLRTTRDRRFEGLVLGNLGAAYALTGQPQLAMENAGRALEALRAVGDRNRQAKTHVMIAKAQRELGKLEEAKRSLEAAIELTEEVRGNAGDDESRAGYIASSGNAHEPYIDLLMELHRLRPLDGFSVAAFEAGERARARSLLDLVAESGINIREGVDEGLLARERNIEEQMQGKAARLMPLLAAQRASATVDALSADLRRLRAEQQQVRAAIREVSPQYASITESRPLMTRDVQALLEPQTALLAYSLGASRSFLWVVTREAVHAYQLPGRSEIEQSVSRLCELVTARATFPRLETAERRKLRIAAADRELDEVSRAAARMLIAPAAKELRGKHLVLAADGILQQLPFALLPDENGEPLIAGHKLSSVPSASVLAGIRQAIAQRPVPTGSIAIFADPVFGASDPRVRGATGQATRGVSGDRDTLRILEHVAAVPGVEPVPAETQLNIPRLPHTRREAQRILSLARGRKIEALGFRATRAAVLESDLAQFRYVHFATHGFADVERPGLSSILLSMVDERGRPQNGFLRADDIYNLKLSSDLVVLSACKTGLGKHVRGEGMFGLTRGFFYAGAARVLVSLWNVNDEATSELMDLLYTRMMARGQPAAVALREAQLELRKDKRWSSPYYWAAFSLQGEWR